MLNILMSSITLKPLAFLSSTAYLMFAEVPLSIPIPVDKGLALSIAVWALIATKRELEKTRKDFKKELREERERADKQMVRADASLDTLNKFADGLSKISDAVEDCPLRETYNKKK